MDFTKLILRVNEDLEMKVPKESELLELANQIFKPENFKHILTYTGYSKDIRSAEDYVTQKLKPRLEDTVNKKELILFIYYKGNIAGRISAHEINYSYKKTELGYLLLKEYTGKGILASCITVLEYFLFKELKINRIELCIDPDNQPSLAIAKKLGYRMEGRLRESYFNPMLNEFRDDTIWSKLKSDA